MATFLILKGYSLGVPQKEVVLIIKRLSIDQETQESIADWIKENCIKIDN